MPTVKAVQSAHEDTTNVEEKDPKECSKHNLMALVPNATKHDIDDTDDDAAPEEILHSTSQIQSHIQWARTTGAALAQSLAQKKRRRQKGTMLKAQVIPSSRKQNLSNLSDENEGVTAVSTENTAQEETPQAQDQISLDNLPSILPDSILLAADNAASAHDAAADVPHKRSSRRNPRRRATAIRNAAHMQIRIPSSKQPKDVHRGPVSVRVLPTQSNLLPPKVVSTTRSIRETWLKGRQSIIKARAQTKQRKSRHNGGLGKMERRLFTINGRARPFT